MSVTEGFLIIKYFYFSFFDLIFRARFADKTTNCTIFLVFFTFFEAIAEQQQRIEIIFPYNLTDAIPLEQSQRILSSFSFPFYFSISGQIQRVPWYEHSRGAYGQYPDGSWLQN